MPSWEEFFTQEKQKQYYATLIEKVDYAYSTETVYPIKEDIYRCFDTTPLEEVKVVILGQDPYINTVRNIPQAHGLSFSIPDGIAFPPSLNNIFKELVNDLQIPKPSIGALYNWAHQGVLLLNSTLTVKAGLSNSHKDFGWNKFTDNAIRYINDHTENTVFILWGGFAQKKSLLIDSSKHYIIQSAHPSPLSAHNGFFGSKPFSKTNDYLKSVNKKEINWQP